VSLAATLPAAILETILIRLSPLFLTGALGDLAAARQAVVRMLSGYHPETGDELCLAANIISFGFQALEALAQAAEPGLPMTRVLRLRGSAVSLNREAEKARRSLARCQKSRHQADSAEPAEPCPEPDRPNPAQANPVQPILANTPHPPANTKSTISAFAKANGLTWTQAYQQRERDKRLAARAKQPEPRFVPPTNPVPQATEAHQPANAQAI
jgi:hypothetical protein